MYSTNDAKGFTLIELMIVVAVVIILAGIGFPLYQDYVRKVRRVDATSVLTEAAQFMERFYTTNHRYDQDRAGTAVAIPADLDEAPKESGVKFYDIAFEAGSPTQTGYTLVATPKGAQAGDGIVTLSNTGARAWDKDNDGNIETGEDCWLKKCS